MATWIFSPRRTARLRSHRVSAREERTGQRARDDESLASFGGGAPCCAPEARVSNGSEKKLVGFPVDSQHFQQRFFEIEGSSFTSGRSSWRHGASSSNPQDKQSVRQEPLIV